MTNVLILDSSASGDASVSRKLTDAAEETIRRRDPFARIVRRDIGARPIPHLTEETVPAIRAGLTETEAAREALALSDALVAELREADLIVIGAPMYNFGIASTLKTWFDYVLRAAITFKYTESGAVGVLEGKRAIVIETRGGLYSEGPAQMIGFPGAAPAHPARLHGHRGRDLRPRREARLRPRSRRRGRRRRDRPNRGARRNRVAAGRLKRQRASRPPFAPRPLRGGGRDHHKRL